MNNNSGEVFTKPWIAEMMLDMCGYLPRDDLTRKKVLEPSSGDGRFLEEIVQRLCSSADRHGVSRDSLCDSISAFDISENNVAKCRNNVSLILRKNGWNETDIKNMVEN